MKRIVIFFFLLLTQVLHAQQPDLVFHQLTEKDGLSYNIVNCFFKDSKGMLWIGTYNGLNRYDGAHFSIIRKGSDSNSLPNNTVHDIAEDRKGNIWGVTDNGVFCYNQQKSTFKNYHTPESKDWPPAFNVLCDKEGVIWVSDRKGLVKYNAAADSFEVIKLKGNDQSVYNEIFIRKNGLAESPDGKGFWAATTIGLLYYDKSAARYTSGKNNAVNNLFAVQQASGICATSFGHYWVMDNNKKELIGFDPVTQQVKYRVKPKEFDALYNTATVFEDNNHLLWICTWGYQVFTVDYLNGNKVRTISHNKDDRSSINGDFFWAAMHEPDGTLWLGTVGGISRCNTGHSFYKVHRFKDSLFYRTNPSIEFISQNKYDSAWWFSTNKGLLIRYNPVDGKTTEYPLNKMPLNKHGLPPAHVNALVFLKNSMYMFTNYGAWVKKGDKGFIPLSVPAPADSVLMKVGVLLHDSLLYCTDGDAVWKYNLTDESVMPIPFSKPVAVNGKPLVTLFPTIVNNNELWFLNGNGWLSRAEGNQLVLHQYAAATEERGDGYYTEMAADNAGNLWMAKKGNGLYYYNPSQKKFRKYSQYDGLVMDHIMAVAADNNGKIWTAAYNKFSVYNPALNSFYNFTLPLSEYNYNYTNFMTTLANGNVVCNVADALVEFIPSRLKPYYSNDKPLISALSAGGVEKLLPGEDRVALSPSENSVLIKFGLLADYEASPYDMLYIMEGAEKNWSYAGSNFEASYNSLQPGDYVFKVKALAKDKSWQTKETLLRIHIATPFYKSWWFISLMLILIASAVYAFYRYRLHQHEQLMILESKAQMLEKEKTTVLYESLKQQLNPHFLFNSLTSLSGLIETDQKLAGSFLEQMSKLYRYILKSSENETVPLKDEIAFVKLFVSLQKTRFKNGLEVNIHVPEEFLHYKIAPVTLQNMIENAIKHNIIDAASPLVIDMFVEEDYLVVRNNLQKKSLVETSNKQGLANLRSLYRYLTPRPIVVDETAQYFEIRIPLI